MPESILEWSGCGTKEQNREQRKNQKAIGKAFERVDGWMGGWVGGWMCQPKPLEGFHRKIIRQNTYVNASAAATR